MAKMVPWFVIEPIHHLEDYDASCQKCYFRWSVVIFMTVRVALFIMPETWRESVV